MRKPLIAPEDYRGRVPGHALRAKFHDDLIAWDVECKCGWSPEYGPPPMTEQNLRLAGIKDFYREHLRRVAAGVRPWEEVAMGALTPWMTDNGSSQA